MTDEGLVVPKEETEVDAAVSPEALPEDEAQIRALVEAGQLGVVEGELEKAAEAPAEEVASEDPPLEPDGPEEEAAEVKLQEGILIPANGMEYKKVFNSWVAAGKPRSFDSGKIRWLAVEDGDHTKFCQQGPKSGMQDYGSLSVGGR